MDGRLSRQFLSLIETTAAILDRGRSDMLGLTLKRGTLRKIYLDRSVRLSMTFLILGAVYLAIAIKHPELLLTFGPLVLGYPHLIASFRYTQARWITLFVAASILTALAHRFIPSIDSIGEIPFGAWPIAIACISFITVRYHSGSFRLIETLVAMGVTGALLTYAWREPILLAGAVLIAHNWIAMAYWIRAAKNHRVRTAAIICSILFGAAHWIVMTGGVDSWFPTVNGELGFANESQITGWYLASWTQDPLIWYRAVVLYSFGLSIHYFVWLKAIPESLSRIERPNSFRMSLELFRRDLGKRVLVLGVGAVVAGTLLYGFSFPVGRVVYFDLALLHGWLELAFLFSREADT